MRRAYIYSNNPVPNKAGSKYAMTSWRCLLLVYPKIDVRWPGAADPAKRFICEMPPGEIHDGVESFKRLPALVSELTNQAAGIEYDIIESARPLSALSSWRSGCWWPSPDDTRIELDRHVVPASYDSIFILWAANHLRNGSAVSVGAWGLGMAATARSAGATYAAVANAPSSAWQVPMIGEVWLHEWLHGVCAYYAGKGYRMPAGDADGADRHGYTRSPETGWTSYYRDLMNGQVAEAGSNTGIPRSAWSSPFSRRLAP